MQRIASRAPARASSTRHIQALILGIVALGLSGVAHAAATVTDVTSPTANSTYGEGSTIVITVEFSEAVDVTSNGNLSPKISLNSSGLAIANYFGGTGTDTLTFHYLVGQNHSAADLNYTSTGALDTGGGAIKATADQTDAVLTLPGLTATGSLGNNKSIVIDASSPTVTQVTSTATTGTYKAGAVIPVTITFNRAVTATSNGNTPIQLTLETGTTDAVVNYTSGSGTTTLQFDYTVAAGHTSADLDYISTSALNLNGGTIKDTNGNNATLTLAAPGTSNSLGASKNIVIDTTAPTVTSVTSTSANGTYGIGAIIPITVTFSEVVVVTSNANLTLETGTTDAVVNYTSGTGSTVLTFNYTVQSGHVAADLNYQATTSLVALGTIRDNGGNDATLTLPGLATANSLGGSKAIVIDTNPSVTALQPAQGPAAGGNVVTIIGTNFSSVSAVTFGGVAATSFAVTSSTTISAQVPAGTGAVAVAVTSAAGTGTKASAYTYLALPTVSAVAPLKGSTAGGKTVTITGTNFSNVLVVRIDGVPVSSYTVAADGLSISAVTPAHAATTTPVSVSVTTAGGTGTGGSYSYMAAPTVTSLDKSSGPIAGLQTVVITGTNFDTTDNGNTVTFGGAAATNIIETSDTSMTVTTAAHAAGAVDVVLTTPGGTVTKAKFYTYIGTPTIVSIAPDEGDVGGGTNITITGTNFTGATGAEINNVAVTNFVVVSATKITCTTPAGTAGAQAVDILAPDRNADAAGTYTYGDKPSISTTTLPDGALKSDYTATTLAATGSPTFKATGLPAGLKLATTGEITGIPTKSGSFAVVVTATNSFGTDTAVLTIKVTNPDAGANTAPELLSQPYAFPNPAIVGEKVTFTAAASDANKDNLSYVWTILTSPGGVEVAKVAGASTSYTFNTAGDYTVNLVVDDGAATASGSLSMSIGGLSVASVALKFNFKSTGKDNVKVSGTLTGIKDYVPADKQVSFTMNNSAYSVTLNAKGVGSGDKTQTFSLSGKLDKTTGAYTTDSVKFTASLVNKDLLASLSDLGFVNADVLKPGAQITLPLFISINGKSYNANVQMIYTAKQGTAGTAAIKKK